MPEFSIIVPVYKTEKYLDKCVKSVLSQSFTNFELILIDDGSPDHSGRICDTYAQKDPRVKVIHKKNGGVSSARNCGIDVAEGRLIWFVDSDDYIAPNSLKELAEIHKAENADIYFFNISETYDVFNGTFNSFLCKYYFTYVVGFAPWNKVYQTEVIRKANLRFDIQETIGEDLLFNIGYYKAIFSAKNGKLFFVERDYYAYINRETSAMHTASKTRLVQQMRLFDKIELMLRELITKQNMTYLFWLHLISGVNQSANGGLTVAEFVQSVDFEKYKPWLGNFGAIQKSFFANEHASAFGRIRITLFMWLTNVGLYRTAGRIVGLREKC